MSSYLCTWYFLYLKYSSYRHAHTYTHISFWLVSSFLQETHQVKLPLEHLWQQNKLFPVLKKKCLSLLLSLNIVWIPLLYYSSHYNKMLAFLSILPSTQWASWEQRLHFSSLYPQYLTYYLISVFWNHWDFFSVLVTRNSKQIP